MQEFFNQLPGRQVAYVGHPFKKQIHSFNVEGGENHPYKVDYLDKIQKKDKFYIFYPFDNPRINSEEKIKSVIETFPKGSLREQKIFNKWVVAEGKVFNYIPKIENLNNYTIREIGIGTDYGSVNPTTFVPIALAYNNVEKKWCLIRLQSYYHNPKIKGDQPTTEFYSNQFRCFLLYLKQVYPNIPITTHIVDSEATHFINRLDADNLPYRKAKKGAGSVDEGVQHLQSLIQKGYYYELERKSISMFYSDGSYELSAKDDALLEMETYQYDSIKSIKEGNNCYKKEDDHSVDARRYIIAEWKETGKCPVV